jgi:hypothetical protein
MRAVRREGYTSLSANPALLSRPRGCRALLQVGSAKVANGDDSGASVHGSLLVNCRIEQISPELFRQEANCMRDALRNMIRVISSVSTSTMVLLLFTVIAIPWLLAQNATEILTNADVVKMVQAHLSADVIVQQIESNPGNYVLTTNGLIRLKQAGVPDRVIVTMQAKRRGEKPEAAGSHGPETAATPQPGAPNPYAWEVKDVLEPPENSGSCSVIGLVASMTGMKCRL